MPSLFLRFSQSRNDLLSTSDLFIQPVVLLEGLLFLLKQLGILLINFESFLFQLLNLQLYFLLCFEGTLINPLMLLILAIQWSMFFCHLPIINYNPYPFNDDLASVSVVFVLELFFNCMVLEFPFLLNSMVSFIQYIVWFHLHHEIGVSQYLVYGFFRGFFTQKQTHAF